mgnify:CR=1 FL=1
MYPDSTLLNIIGPTVIELQTQRGVTTHRACHTYLPPVLLCYSRLQYPHNNHPHLIIPVDHLSTSDILQNHITLSANTQNIEAFIVHLDVANSYNVYIVYQLKAKQAAQKNHGRS